MYTGPLPNPGILRFMKYFTLIYEMEFILDTLNHKKSLSDRLWRSDRLPISFHGLRLAGLCVVVIPAEAGSFINVIPAQAGIQSYCLDG